VAASALLCNQLVQDGSSAPPPGGATAPKTSADQCLAQVLTNSIGAQCAKTAGCESVRAQAGQLCSQLHSIGCKPKVCSSAPPLLAKSFEPMLPLAVDALVGCFDVRASADARAVVRAVFPRPDADEAPPPPAAGARKDAAARARVSVAKCAVECADAAMFALEDGRCACAEGPAGAGWPVFAADAAQCGAACPAERVPGDGMPCGLEDRLAVYRTQETLRLLPPAMLRAEQWARAPDHVRASAWLAAVALSSALIAVAHTARQLLAAQPDDAVRSSPTPPSSIQLM
jgi:hypothetical protein